MACWTRDLCIWHYTEWQHVGLVICVSDIIQNDAMLDSYLCIWHYTEWCWTVICVSDIIQNDPCWTCDLCIWHYTEWLLDLWSVYLTLYRMMLDSWSVGLVICVSDIIQNDSMLDSWSVYLTWMMAYSTRNLCIWIIQNDVGLVICVSDIIQNDAMLDSWSVYLTLYRMTGMLDLYSDLCIWHYTEWC